MGYPEQVGRSIWIGDVHGCALELADLLDAISPTAEDRVIFVGDLVARGPDTPGVLRMVRETSALCVRGNHEHRLILAHQARVRGKGALVWVLLTMNCSIS